MNFLQVAFFVFFFFFFLFFSLIEILCMDGVCLVIYLRTTCMDDVVYISYISTKLGSTCIELMCVYVYICHNFIWELGL